VGIALALEQSAHVVLRRHCEQQHLLTVRQCPDVHSAGAGIWAADHIEVRMAEQGLLKRHGMQEDNNFWEFSC
jgi:hypothetical protein